MIEINIKVKISDDSGSEEEAGIELKGDIIKVAGVLMKIIDKYMAPKEV